MAATVTVTGDKEVARLLDAIGAKSVRLKAAMGDIANFAERQIRNVPIRTGRLAASTRGGPGQLLGVHDTWFKLGSQVPYSAFVFEGTKHMRARPPAINAQAIARQGANRIKQELERA